MTESTVDTASLTPKPRVAVRILVFLLVIVADLAAAYADFIAVAVHEGALADRMPAGSLAPLPVDATAVLVNVVVPFAILTTALWSSRYWRRHGRRELGLLQIAFAVLIGLLALGLSIGWFTR
jgi:hypothetical protein